MMTTVLAAVTAGTAGCRCELAPKELRISGLPEGSLTFVSCDDNGAWAFLDAPLNRALATRAGLESAQAAQRGSLIRLTRFGFDRRLEMDSGLVVAAAIPTDRSLWVVSGIPDGLHVTSAGMKHSADGGATWRGAGLPRAVAAMAFVTDESGYAWDEATVFRTDDRGASWRRGEVTGFILATGRGTRRGAVGSTGELWVPARRVGEAEWTTIAVVQPDLSFRIINAWENGTVEDVLPLPDGEALVLLSDVAKTTSRGVLVKSRGMEMGGESWTPPPCSIKDASVGGANVAILTVEGPVPTNYFSRYRNTLWWSSDKGSTWASHDITSQSPGSICVSGSGVWTSSKETRSAGFSLLAR